MRTVKLAGLMLLLVASQALGQSIVAFTLELGGNPNGAHCSTGGNKPYVAGSPVDNPIPVFPLNSKVSWDLRVSASGTQQSGNGAGYAIRGVANFVYDLELRAGSEAGPLVTNAVFESAVNNGTNGCPLTSASFAFGMNVWNWGPARVMDPMMASYAGEFHGGVRMGSTGNAWYWGPAQVGYPKPAYNYATVEPGKAIGMGAGYHCWDRSSYPTKTVAGVGQVAPAPGDPEYGPQGTGPVCEGRIDTNGLPEGIYVLKVIPGAGINVLRGDKNLAANQNAFATAANQTAGDTITFELAPGGAPCAIAANGWASVRSHTGKGDLPITLLPAATGMSATSEPRGGGVQKITVQFDGDISTVYTQGQVVVSGGSLAVTNDYLSGNSKLVIELSGSADKTYYTINVRNSVSCLPLEADSDCVVKVLEGDTNSDGYTNLIDAAEVKGMNGQDPSVGTNAKLDTNVDGYINLIDFAAVKTLNGGMMP